MTTKEKVLHKLINNKESLSGESLAKEFNVSRAAVWKAINSLREEGYFIKGTTNGGYVLEETSDLFCQSAMEDFFYSNFPQYKNSHIEVFKEIDSTNTYAKKLLNECGSLRNEKSMLSQKALFYSDSIILAESQTAGRGRLGRTFVSPEKTGIYLSIIKIPKDGIKSPSRLTALSAVAVCRAVKKLYKVEPCIKWINDIFLNKKKICGILTEGIANFESGMIDAAVIGIGINIENNPEAFKGEVSKVAGGILDSSEEKNVSRIELASFIAGEVLNILDSDEALAIEEYKKLSFIIGQTVKVRPLSSINEESYFAKAVDINENAELVVELEDKTRRTLISGEVSLCSENFV